jgi:hypothetical protein
MRRIPAFSYDTDDARTLGEGNLSERHIRDQSIVWGDGVGRHAVTRFEGGKTRCGSPIPPNRSGMAAFTLPVGCDIQSRTSS